MIQLLIGIPGRADLRPNLRLTRKFNSPSWFCLLMVGVRRVERIGIAFENWVDFGAWGGAVVFQGRSEKFWPKTLIQTLVQYILFLLLI